MSVYRSESQRQLDYMDAVWLLEGCSMSEESIFVPRGQVCLTDDSVFFMTDSDGEFVEFNDDESQATDEVEQECVESDIDILTEVDDTKLVPINVMLTRMGLSIVPTATIQQLQDEIKKLRQQLLLTRNVNWVDFS